ncbi:VOC family protein [Actinomadura rugatobispora]|uniref:VOC family protein n=1 Tax=Actinomadura rugatobispora TaxID=1994 RepID=A0ABW1AE37_9ACTN|nr:VOC family protein [Actinomadura rugatobispora]
MTHLTSNPPVGTPTWLDLGIPDLGRAKEFYGGLFGWEFQDYGPEAGHYHACLLRGEPVAGIMQLPEPTGDYWWNVYFATDDCDGTVKRVTDAGGSAVEAPMDVMDQGRMAILKDPVGAQFGLWEGRAHIGSRIVNEPGSFVWNELVTADSARAADFYRAVFEYTLEPIQGDMDYTVLHRPDGQSIGGVMGSPGASSGWFTYFDVDDPDAAARKVGDLGGTVVDEPQDTPYGRIGTAEDPFGVRFHLIRPSEM